MKSKDLEKLNTLKAKIKEIEDKIKNNFHKIFDDILLTGDKSITNKISEKEFRKILENVYKIINKNENEKLLNLKEDINSNGESV